MPRRALIDGPVDPRDYARARTKIVHLLKQGVGKQRNRARSLAVMIRAELDNHKDWLERKWIVSARRCYAILNRFPSWNVIAKLDVEQELKPAFRRSAVINAIKITGGTSTSAAALSRGAKATSNKLAAQLRRLRPRVVICGGTFDALTRVGVIPSRSVTAARTGFQYARVGSVTYLEARHPGHRGSHKDEYEAFARTARQALRQS